MTRRFVLAALVVLAATPAAAQQTDAGAGPRQEMGVRFRPRALVSVNALGLVTGTDGVEGELRLFRWVTVAGAVGTTRLRQNGRETDTDFVNAEAKVRLYPFGRAPGGLSIAATGGRSMRMSVMDEKDPFSGSRWTHGASVDYHWLVGPAGRVLIGVGTGVRQYHLQPGDGARSQIAGMRFSVGYAF